MTKYLVIDFETNDPYIDRGMGAGWVYAVNKVPGCDFRVLGAALYPAWLDTQTMYLPTGNETDENLIAAMVEECDVLVMHNASYDLGCLKVMGIDVKDKPVLDTMIMAKLFKGDLMPTKHYGNKPFSLEALGKRYTNIRKDNDGLRNAVLEADLFPYLKKEIDEKAKWEQPCDTNTIGFRGPYKRSFDEARLKKVDKWVKSNMAAIQDNCYEAMAKYACLDVDVTYALMTFFLENNTQEGFEELCLRCSFLVYPMMAATIRGVRVDLNACRVAVRDFQPIIEKAYRDIYEIAGEEFNIKSNIDVPRVFDKLGIIYPRTDLGNPSIVSKWLEVQEYPICKAIVRGRLYKNLSDNAIAKMLKMQVYTLGMTEEEVAGQDYGRVYPTWAHMAQGPGRTSCSTPNLCQIPKRDKVIGPICRGIFIAEEGEQFYAPDWSNQEGRIHLHYANVMGFPGADEYLTDFIADPSFDMHSKVAGIMGSDRFTAKTNYLAKAFGAGGAKICDGLGLPTDLWKPPGSSKKLRVAGSEGKKIINKFNKAIPYLKPLSEAFETAVKKNGYIKTIGGRRIHMSKKMSYKGLSYGSQGSGACQMMLAATLAYKAGLPVCGYIYDEMIMSGTPEQGKKLQECMIEGAKLKVPSYVELGSGKNWSEAH